MSYIIRSLGPTITFSAPDGFLGFYDAFNINDEVELTLLPSDHLDIDFDGQSAFSADYVPKTLSNGVMWTSQLLEQLLELDIPLNRTVVNVVSWLIHKIPFRLQVVIQR